jgi:hypothetical protein
MATENRPEEIAALHEHALRLLVHMQDVPPTEPIDGFRPILRLWHYPAFDAYRAWMLFQATGGCERNPHWHVREVVWDGPHDMSRFAVPLEGVRQGFRSPPTITVRDAKVSSSVVSHSLRQLAHLPIPVIGIEGPMGLDGDTSGIESFDEFLRVSLEWWWVGPNEWRAFTQAVVHLREALAQSFE